MRTKRLMQNNETNNNRQAKQIAFALFSSKVGTLLLSPKTTLPALLNAAGAPSALSSILVPIKESGSMLPQAWLAKVLTAYQDRLLIWQIGMILQLLATVMIFLCGIYLADIQAGIGVIAGLIIWSVSRSLSSLTMKDIQGQHIDKGNRGKLIGLASTMSALVTFLVAAFSIIYSQNIDATLLISEESKATKQKLVFLGSIAILMQFLCVLSMYGLHTKIQSSSSSSMALKLTPNLSRFIWVRALLSHSALIAPLFVLSYAGNSIEIVGYLIIVQAATEFCSAYIWGSLSDKNARLSMQLGTLVAIFSSATLLVISLFWPQVLTQKTVIIVLFGALNIGYCGIRTARKTYAVDIAEDHHRTEFVAKSNTYVGLFILLAGGFYAFLLSFSMLATLLMMTTAMLVGIVLSFGLKKER